MAEIEEITSDPKVTHVYLEVETIGANVEYALQLCQALAQFNDRRSAPIYFKINLAVTHKLASDINLMNRLFSEFNRANIMSINIGLESGSERIRNDVLRRPSYSNEDFVKFCSYARKYNIKINIYVMICLPGESAADFKETLQLVRRCEPNDILLSIYYPYAGTDLYQLAREMKLIKEGIMDHTLERKRVSLNLPEFPKWRVLKEYVFFKFNVYKGKRSLKLRIIYSIKAAIEMNYKLDKAYFYFSRYTKIGTGMFKKYKMDF